MTMMIMTTTMTTMTTMMAMTMPSLSCPTTINNDGNHDDDDDNGPDHGNQQSCTRPLPRKTADYPREATYRANGARNGPLTPAMEYANGPPTPNSVVFYKNKIK